MVSETRDERYEGLIEGLKQLNIEQLLRIKYYTGEMVLDTWNYIDGKYCPLAIGLGLDKGFKNPSHEKVYSVLALMGYKINNTWGRAGQFYTTNRREDLMKALNEVIKEKQCDQTNKKKQLTRSTPN